MDLTSEISLARVLQQVTDTALDLIGARYAAIGVMAPDGRTLESFTTSGMTPEERERIGAAAAGARHPRPGDPRVARHPSP